MNIVKIHGGIGNQIFQYAFGLVQKKKGLEVAYDRSWYDDFKDITFREYHLDKFGVEVDHCNFLPQTTIRETKYGYNPGLFSMVNVNFFGYWQFLSYYDSIIDNLRSTFKLNEKYYTLEYNSIQGIIQDNTSVHVRRGDYLTTGGFLTVPIEFYKRAISLSPGKVFVFSDDMEWCKKNFRNIDRDIIYVDLPDYLSFDLMRQFKNQIIANSTFSQWAAHLNPYPDKVIYYPETPIVNKPFEIEKKLHYPKSWKLC